MSTPLDWSKIWLIVGIGGWALLVAVNATWLLGVGEPPIPAPLHTLAVAALMVLTMGSWNGMRERRIRRETEARVAVVQAYLHMAERSQTFVGRATIAQAAHPHAEVNTEAIEMPAATAEPTHPPRRRRRRRAGAAEVEGLTPEMVDIARRTSDRLRGSS